MQDTIIPTQQWTFDEDVTAAFDDMLQRSIPQYEVMRQTVFNLACHYRQEKTDIIDLGCSRGEALAPLVDKFGVHNRYIGIDVSEPMLEVARLRFKGLIQSSIVDISYCDLRTEYPPVFASVTLCILTLQFTPIEYRQQILKRIFDHTIDGGVLILVEKVIGATATIDEMMVDLYYGLKSSNGYSQEQIERKRFSLEGVLVPVTARWNEELLHISGYREVDCFWRWMNFAGWIAKK